jgi:hypothetical protein
MVPLLDSRSAGDRGPLASSGVAAVLALQIAAARESDGRENLESLDIVSARTLL